MRKWTTSLLLISILYALLFGRTVQVQAQEDDEAIAVVMQEEQKLPEEIASVETVDENEAYAYEAAAPEWIYLETEYVNPLCPKEAEVLPEGILDEEAAGQYAAAPEDAYLTLEDIGAYLRQCCKNRDTSVQFVYVVKGVPTKAVFDELIAETFRHTGGSTEGDYLKYQVASYRGELRGYYDSDLKAYVCTFGYTFSWYTDAAQEAKMDAEVGAVLQNLKLSGKSDYQKAKEIYGYITSNVTYDYTNLNDDSYKLKYSAYAALINKTAVCQGYANLLYRMLLECGIDCRIVSGIGNGGPHAWNIVRLNGQYYCADATWDKKSFIYFLKGEANFDDHQPEEQFLTAEFRSSYSFADVDYVPTAEDLNTIVMLAAPVITSVEGDFEGVTVEWNAVEGAEAYRVYCYSSEGEWIALGDTDKLQYTIKTLPIGGDYIFAVQCVSADGKKITGSRDDKGTSYHYEIFIPKPTYKLTNIVGGKRLTLSCETAKGQIYCSKTPDFSDTVKIVENGAYVNYVNYVGSVYLKVGREGYYSEVEEVVLNPSQVKAITVTVEGGRITLKTTTAGASIWYTLDGTKPSVTTGGNCTNAILLTNDSQGSIPICGTVNLKAVAVKKGYRNSAAVDKTISVAPEMSVLTVENSMNGVVLSWTKSEQAQGYIVYRKEPNGKYVTLSKPASADVLSYKDATAVEGKTYIYAIRAYYDTLKSDYEPVEMEVKAPVVKVSAKQTEKGIALIWDRVAGVEGYRIYRKEAGGKYAVIKKITKGETVTYTDTTAEAGKTYYYAVRAGIGDIYSEYIACSIAVK